MNLSWPQNLMGSECLPWVRSTRALFLSCWAVVWLLTHRVPLASLSLLLCISPFLFSVQWELKNDLCLGPREMVVVSAPTQ
jgi:hypothetical protein